ncbi:hypothetical protein SPRG_07589 [Saprolegnia parasitica CBS 223.65]|uniref:Glutamyl/glutaminyl-tRNA synthetase class Ib catalytic domain-containing protein n=1 Tax=Saprolegnia parasitica (strain CBS 223.65) TaxID=695850 RepID=A0A067CCG3_SAPPC|nr:hypothetical protein SPRG_07589 [Saprolegnia parasitica CBS 223.65]KDO26875.1 hypothetical protein SPRG_07589 [Saprolegnia parasitica CBS 223.65]|eukprot:XP_012202268.1 hypothetical protein SPRG_07589 [Saprolegnia parasitica CBS 223.65]
MPARKLIVRFDDTSPSKEKDEFEQAILQELARLNVCTRSMASCSPCGLLLA